MIPNPDLTRLRHSPTITVTVTAEDGATVLNITYHEETGPGLKPDNALYVIDAPFRIPAGSQAAGISFEVRGDGSKTDASIMLGYADTQDVALAFEAIFPLDSTGWTKKMLRWDDFVQNYLAWDPRCTLDHSTTYMDPAQVGIIGFGLGNYLNHHYPAHASFQLRNINLVGAIPEREPSPFSEGWSQTKAVLSERRELRILLIGDSITEMGGSQSFGHYLGRKIKEAWGSDCEIANCGIGGHSVRGGTIILPRSLRKMPAPELVFVLFGANDVKALGLKPGFNEQTFRMQIEALIDKVRSGTRGMADICLLSGVPRLLPDSVASAGTIEQIVNGVREAATNKKTAFVDTFEAYLHLAPAQKETCYMDTVHLNPAGQKLLGDLIFDRLRSEISVSE